MKAGKLTRETINQLGVEPRKFPEFSIGDTIAVSQWITEGNKKRVQVFEGDVIARHGNGASSTFTVRKLGANNVFVERIYPYYTPIIDSIKVVRKGDVRRAKLYYLRDRIGKKARVKELVQTKEQKAASTKKEADRLAALEKAEEAKVAAAAKKAEAKTETVAKEEAAPVKKEAAPQVEKKAEAPKAEKADDSAKDAEDKK